MKDRWADKTRFYKSNLSTKLKVGHRYGNLSTGNNQDNKDEVEKTKQVIKLVFPNCLEK